MVDVDTTIEALKRKMDAPTDADLARKLLVDKRTVSAWRSRGSVPDRYKAVLEGDSHQAIMTSPLKWGRYEECAFRLALFRFTRVKAKAAISNEFRTIFDAFAHPRGFWLLMTRSQRDIATVMEDRTDSVDTAMALVMHDDIAAGDDAIERDRLALEWRLSAD
jgi:hypothetical protein